MITEIDKAYAAGIIDGEGSIMLLERTGAMFGRISVGMSDPEAVFWLKETFDGSIREKVSKSNKRWKTIYMWDVNNQSTVAFCKQILPYLKTKKKQATLLIAFYDNKLPKIGTRLSVDEVGRRRELKTEMTQLNLRGVS